MDPFVAEIRILPFTFPPIGWAWCNGQLIPISQNTALFSLLGTIYGGDGKASFALPDLQDRIPMHPGEGPGLSLHDLGEQGGSDEVTLLQSEIPSHSHEVAAARQPGDLMSPEGNYIARSQEGNVYREEAANTTFSTNMIRWTGEGLPHNNMQPYLTTNFCIAIQGVFPHRS